MEQFIEDQYNENTRKKTQQNAEKSSLSHVSECPTTTVHSVSSAADYQQGQRAISISVLLLMVAQNNVLINRDSSWWKIYEVLAARMTKLITARARKNKRTGRMLAMLTKTIRYR